MPSLQRILKPLSDRNCENSVFNFEYFSSLFYKQKCVSTLCRESTNRNKQLSF